MKTNLNFFGIVVKDLAAMTHFFTDVLGYELNSAASMPVYSQLQSDGGATIGMFADYEMPDVQQVDPAFAVDDIDQTYADWQASGVEMVTAIKDMPFGRTFLFRTPEGHILRVWKPNMDVMNQ